MGSMEGSRSLSITVGDIDASTSNINIGYFEASRVKADERSKLAQYRKALYVVDPKVEFVERKPLRAAGTCEWIKRNRTYRQWLTGDKKILRILGSPGKGKTLLSIFLIEDLAKERPVIYVFCRNGQLDSAAAVMRILIWQLSAYCPNAEVELRQCLDLQNDQCVQDTFRSRETLWTLFTALLQQSQEPSFCIIDGFDECDQDSRDWLAGRFTEVAIPRSIQSIVLSRPLPVFIGSTSLELQLDDLDEVQKDVELGISNGVSELRVRVKDIDDLFFRYLESQIHLKAQGTFLWVGFAMSELRKCETRLQISRTLESLPVGLFQLYDRMIAQIPAVDRGMCSQILRWVVLAVEPLSLDQLADVIGSGDADSDVVRDYVAHCGPFLVVERGSCWNMSSHQPVVNLVHQSAKDYLLQECRATKLVIEPFRIYPQIAHAEIAKTCLAHLSLYLDRYLKERTKQKLVNDQCKNIREHFTKAASGSPFLDYAVEHWGHHADQASAHSEPFFREFQGLFGKSSAFFDLLRAKSLMCDSEGYSPLHIASYHGVISWARSILSQRRWQDIVRKRVNTKCHDMTALRIAALRGHQGLVQLLIENGADVNDHSAWDTPLSIAARRGDEEIVRVLIENGADVNSGLQRNLLGHAARAGRKGMVQLLVEQGADVNGCTGEGPLSTAVRWGDEGMVRLLIGKGADVNSRSGWETPLSIAAEYNFEGIARLLIEKGAEVNDGWGRFSLRIASRHCHENMARLLIEQGADVNGGSGESPLSIATQHGRERTARLLIERSADVNGSLRHRPLIWAARSGSTNIVQLLMSAGADPKSTDSTGVTALHSGATSGMLPAMQQLLEQGADVNALDAYGNTPLACACCGGGTETVKFLLSQGADLHRGNRHGTTPLHWATSTGNLAIVRVLLEAGADRMTVDGKDWPSVRYAGEATHDGKGNKDEQMFNLLCDSRTDLLMRVDHSLTEVEREKTLSHLILLDAIKGDNLALVELLQTKYSCLREREDRSVRADCICTAADYNSLSVAKYLLDNGAAIDAAGRSRKYSYWEPMVMSPLHWAAYRVHCEMILFLLGRGADANQKVAGDPAKQYHGFTALDIVFRGQNAMSFYTRWYFPHDKTIKKAVRLIIAHRGKMNKAIDEIGGEVEMLRMPTHEEMDFWMRDTDEDTDSDHS